MAKASASQRDKIRNEAARIGAKLGLTPVEQASLAYNNKVKQKAIGNLTNWQTQVGVAEQRLETALNMAIEYAKQLTPSKIKKINQLVISGETEFGAGLPAQYGEAIMTASREYGRLVSGPTSNAMLPVEAMKQTDALLSKSSSVEQLVALKDTMLRNARATTTAVKDQLQSLSSSLTNPNLAGAVGMPGAMPQQPAVGGGAPGDYSYIWK